MTWSFTWMCFVGMKTWGHIVTSSHSRTQLVKAISEVRSLLWLAISQQNWENNLLQQMNILFLRIRGNLLFGWNSKYNQFSRYDKLISILIITFRSFNHRLVKQNIGKTFIEKLIRWVIVQTWAWWAQIGPIDTSHLWEHFRFLLSRVWLWLWGMSDMIMLTSQHVTFCSFQGITSHFKCAWKARSIDYHDHNQLCMLMNILSNKVKCYGLCLMVLYSSLVHWPFIKPFNH